MKTLSDQGSEKTLFKQLLSVALMALAMLSFYLLSTFVPPGAASYGLSFVALAMVIVTALARVNDIGVRHGWVWNLRRIALITTGAASAGIILMGEPPAWKDTMFHVGIALTWFTTPGMPPWWKYIAGGEGDDTLRGSVL